MDTQNETEFDRSEIANENDKKKPTQQIHMHTMGMSTHHPSPLNPARIAR